MMKLRRGQSRTLITSYGLNEHSTARQAGTSAVFNYSWRRWETESRPE